MVLKMSDWKVIPMTARKFRWCQNSATALFAAFVVVMFTPHNALAQRGAECPGSINYEQADISAIIDEIALRTGKKFVVAPQVNGRVTIKSGPNAGLCPDEAWELFQAALRVSGFVATPINGDSYKIVAIQLGAREAGPSSGDARPGDIITRIERLSYVDARSAAVSLAQIVSERGVVNPVSGSNSLILVDTAKNVERMLSVLRQIDRDTRIDKTVTLANSSAMEVAGVVRDLADELSKEGTRQQTPISVIPVDATNSLVIRAEPKVMRRVLAVIAELDRIGENTSEVQVIRLAHQNAETMAVTLREIAGAQGLSISGGEGGSATPGRGRAVISVDVPTNAIIISGDANIQKILRQAIRELDVRPSQVLVEAIIVDISENTARALGVEYLISGSGSGSIPFSTTSFSGTPPDLLGSAASYFMNGEASSGSGSSAGGDLFNNEVLDIALTSLLGLNGFALGGAGQTNDGTIYSAILTAIKQDTDSNVLSLPSVITLDNKPGRLQAGQEIPITTGEAVGNNFQNAFRTVSREEVGVIFEVTPRIGDGGVVTLQIRQETSSVAGQILNTSTDLITNKRVIETSALVDDGDILVVGGLIDQSAEIVESKVPLLGDIPVAGNLFKTQARSRDRRNLMLFLRPTIISDRDTARAATAKKMDYIRARGLLDTGQPVSELERLIDEATGIDGVGPAQRNDFSDLPLQDGDGGR